MITHYLHHAAIVLPDGDGTREVRAQIAIIDYEPASMAYPDCPAQPEYAEIEIRDDRGFPRPDWEFALEHDEFVRLRDEALVNWHAEESVDRAEADMERRALNHEYAVRGQRIGNVWV